MHLAKVFYGLRISALNFPRDFFLSIGTTNICNAKCSFCIYPKLINKRQMKLAIMPMKVFAGLLDEWSSAGSDTVGLTFTVGDILMDPFFRQRMEEISARGMRAKIITNGIGITQENVAHLVSARWIGISAQGTDPGLYNEVYGVNRYREFIDGLELLLVANSEAGEPCEISINFRNKQSVFSILKSSDYRMVIKPHLTKKVTASFLPAYETWAGQIVSGECPGPMKRVLKSVRPCNGARSLTVRPDGGVMACGCIMLGDKPDDLLLGMFPDQSLKEIVSGDKFKKFFHSFNEVKFDTCKQCTNYQPIH